MEPDLAALLAHWDLAIARMQRRHPARWAVRGWSPEEVRDALTLRLVERAGEPLDLIRERLSELRRANRLNVSVAEIPEAPARVATEEEQLIDAESESLRSAARARAEASLSQPQRRWYAAMRMAANAGEFFEASDDLNLSAAARLLEKNRSSATRAYEELQSTFQRELKRQSP